MPRFAFTPEHDELRSVLRSLLARHSSERAVRVTMDSPSGWDATLWRRLADEIGVQGLAIPEEYGGAGFGDLELGIAMEESGRALMCAPLLSTVVLAAKAVLAGDDEGLRRRILPQIAAGDLVSTLAYRDGATPVSAHRAGNSFTASGIKDFVIDGESAQLFVISATVDGANALFTLDASAPGLVREPMTTLDLTRRQSRLRLENCPVDLLVGPERGDDVLGGVLDAARVAVSLEQIGGTEACLDASVSYAGLREQFGRRIGSFQAVKHRCADMFVELELARSTAYNALWALHERADDLPLAAAMAKALTSDAFVFVASENIQVHGGIGFSWEHAAHLYFRRARSSAVMFGDAHQHRATIAELLGV